MTPAARASVGLKPLGLKPLGLLLMAIGVLAGCAPVRGPAGHFFGEPAACRGPAGLTPAASANAASLTMLVWSPFGRPERGWAIYAPRLRRELNTPCPPDSTGFAARLARWQAAHGLTPTGRVDAASFQAIKAHWQAMRPFFNQRAAGVCPDPPAARDLIILPPEDASEGKTVLMRREAGWALHRMLAAARIAAPAAARGSMRLAAFSGYRSPAYDAARCARQGDCDGVGRAVCSAHRTGLAVDLVLGAAPGYAVDSSADANRLYQTGTPAYRWLVDNAGRFGFVNYPFEPWHWEWTGAAR